MNNLITEVTVSGERIAPLIANIEAILDGESRDEIIIALISMALIVTYPEINEEQLRQAVQDTSRFICLVLDPPEEGKDPRMLMN